MHANGEMGTVVAHFKILAWRDLRENQGKPSQVRLLCEANFDRDRKPEQLLSSRDPPVVFFLQT